MELSSILLLILQWHQVIHNKIAPKTDLNLTMMDSVDITLSEEKKMGIWMENAENAWQKACINFSK